MTDPAMTHIGLAGIRGADSCSMSDHGEGLGPFHVLLLHSSQCSPKLGGTLEGGMRKPARYSIKG